MDIAAVMDALGQRLDIISGLRAYPYPEQNPQPPAALVSYPEPLTYDVTMGRGKDGLTLPVAVVLPLMEERVARDQILAYARGSGPLSVKQILESGVYTAFEAVRVMSCEFDVVNIAGADMIRATFTLDIIGHGS